MKTAEVDALEDCLERLQAGASLEQILALYPQWTKELRPLLESALLAWSLRVTAPVPEGGMARSRVRFVEKAVAQPLHNGMFNLGFRLSRSLLACISALVILAIGTSFVSAQSLPGDILYPVKLAGEQTRLMLTANSTQRLNLQESYDQTRADEVEDLLQFHRQMEVTFVGLLAHPADDHWQVGGVKVVFPLELNSTFDQMLNAYVEVTGLSQSDDIVQVSQIQLRELDFSGTVTSMTSEMWFIDQVGVRVEDATVINRTFSVGDYVSVKAYRLEDGTLNARQIDGIDSGKQEVQQPVATSQSGENEVESSNSGNNATATNDEGNFAHGETGRLPNTATEQPEVLQPTSTHTTTTAGIRGGGNEQSVNTSTDEPSDTPSAKPTFTATATDTPTKILTATATNTPTQNRDGENQSIDGRGKTQSPSLSSSPTSTPTSTPGGSEDGNSHPH